MADWLGLRREHGLLAAPVGLAWAALVVVLMAFYQPWSVARPLDIVPIIAAFFVVMGLPSAWTYRRTAHPWVPALANAVMLAFAIAGTFPLVVG